jgi:hypothetical protein
MALIEIVGSPIKNGGSFHGKLLNNQMVSHLLSHYNGDMSIPGCFILGHHRCISQCRQGARCVGARFFGAFLGAKI